MPSSGEFGLSKPFIWNCTGNYVSGTVIMKLYDEYVLPYVINCACSMRAIERQRGLVVPEAKGKILEIGMGSGLNLKHYDPNKVEHLWGLEPSQGMRRKAQANIEASDLPLEWLDSPSESIPLDDDIVDTLVLTYTLCTIPNPEAALAEMQRVLKPDGIMVFSEHGVSPDENVRRWQHRINSVWKKLAGGCNLNRDIPALLSNAGFKLDKLNTGYIKGPKIATFQYWGRASI